MKKYKAISMYWASSSCLSYFPVNSPYQFVFNAVISKKSIILFDREFEFQIKNNLRLDKKIIRKYY